MFGLSGMHALIIVGVWILMAAAAVAVIFLAIRLSRRPAPGALAAAPAPDSLEPSPAELRAARLAEVESLRASGLLTEPEYEAKRAEILGEI